LRRITRPRNNNITRAQRNATQTHVLSFIAPVSLSATIDGRMRGAACNM
jgi:hypothetical protein